jgi:tetratricopeptide (TPR) repeat protein
LRRGFDFAGFAQPALNAEEQRHVETAIRLYRRVLELNPYDEHACHNLGWLYWLAQRRPDALDHLSRAVALDGDFPLYRISLGLVREYGGVQAEADEEYAQALRSSPSVADSPFFLELRRRAPERAERLITGAITYFEGQPGTTAKAKLGRLYLDRDPERATRLLEEAVKDSPSLSRPWANLAHLYELRGDAARAERSYRKALFIDQDVQTISRLGNLYERQQRTQEAAGQYRWAVNTWRNQSTVHASRVRRIYHSRFTLRDDIIPRGLSVYTSPAFEMVKTCERLAVMLRQAGDQDAAAFYEKLAREYAP